MEVHHHPHTERKKWTHYFWEFLMLFLAVTAGFFTENLREHRIELKREKKFMRSLLLDLKADTTHISLIKAKRIKRNEQCDSLINLLTSPLKSNKNALVYFYGRAASRRIHFYPQDGALQQLKNSGGFRVVYDQEVLDSINSYELLLKFNMENVEVEEKELSEYSQVAAKLFNVKIFQQMLTGGSISMPAGNPALLSNDAVLRNELCVKLHYWKRTSVSILESFDRLKQNAENLIRQIEKEYHLE